MPIGKVVSILSSRELTIGLDENQTFLFSFSNRTSFEDACLTIGKYLPPSEHLSAELFSQCIEDGGVCCAIDDLKERLIQLTADALQSGLSLHKVMLLVAANPNIEKDE